MTVMQYWRTWANESQQGLYSSRGRVSYREILWSLAFARIHVLKIVSLWNLTGISVEQLSRCPSNIRAIEIVSTRTSRLWYFTRSCGKTSVHLVRRYPIHRGLIILTDDNNTRCRASFVINGTYAALAAYLKSCITVALASCHLKSPVVRQFVQQVTIHNIKNMNRHNWSSLVRCCWKRFLNMPSWVFAEDKKSHFRPFHEMISKILNC